MHPIIHQTMWCPGINGASHLSCHFIIAHAQLIVGKQDTLPRKLAFISVSALALTAWDLFLDPQMVGWGFWVWDQPGVYFGIPLVNYGGWLMVSALITVIVQPPTLPTMPLAGVYGLVWFLQSVGLGVFWGQAGPAVVGSVAMGGIMLIAYWRQQ